MQVPVLRWHCNNVLAVNNAGLHHAREEEARMEMEAGVPHARLEFVPPYSPKLNPVEIFFGLCKQTLKQRAWSQRLLYSGDDISDILHDLVKECITDIIKK